MEWTAWRRYFEDNSRRSLPELHPVALCGLSEEQRLALVSSFAKFYLGEAGEGRIAHEIDSAVLPGIDDDYRAALKLFVREEGRHARVLAAIIACLGGRLQPEAWTERLFRRGRRLAGIRLKLLVLLAAEVISLGFYGNIARRLPQGSIRDALRDILDEERMHLEFHVAFFRGQLHGRWRRVLFRATWRLVATSAWAVVLLDHRHTLTLLGGRLRSVSRELHGIARSVERDVLEPVTYEELTLPVRPALAKRA